MRMRDFDSTSDAMTQSREPGSAQPLFLSVCSLLIFHKNCVVPAGLNGDFYFCPVEKVLRGGLSETVVEICNCHVSSRWGAGGVCPCRGRAQQAPQKCSGEAAGQTRELAGNPASVRAWQDNFRVFISATYGVTFDCWLIYVICWSADYFPLADIKSCVS